jgi:hypothetical protein
VISMERKGVRPAKIVFQPRRTSLSLIGAH